MAFFAFAFGLALAFALAFGLAAATGFGLAATAGFGATAAGGFGLGATAGFGTAAAGGFGLGAIAGFGAAGVPIGGAAGGAGGAGGVLGIQGCVSLNGRSIVPSPAWPGRSRAATRRPAACAIRGRESPACNSSRRRSARAPARAGDRTALARAGAVRARGDQRDAARSR